MVKRRERREEQRRLWKRDMLAKRNTAVEGKLEKRRL